jgi:P27 family predicted phage terminase small subunit
MPELRLAPRPPRTLCAEARALWSSIVAEHIVDDGASFELLRQLCESVSNLRAIQRQIRKDGLMIKGSKGQMRPHPLFATEAEYRRAILACIRALKIDVTAEY